MKILILNLIPNTIGDTLFLTPLFSVLKRNKHTVHTTVSPLNYDLIKENKDLDKIIIIDELKDISSELPKSKKIIIYLKMSFNLVKKIKKEKYDACIITQPNFFLTPIIPFFSGIKKRIGYKFRKAWFSFLLTDKVYFEEDIKKLSKRHYVDTVLDLATYFIIKETKEDRTIKLNIDKESEKKVKNLRYKLNISKYICIQPGAKWDRKKWPKEKFKKISKKILFLGYDVIILGSNKEFSLGEYIKGNNNRIFNFCGKFSLMETAAIMKNAKISICNDSGLAHISSAVGTKTAVIYGATSPKHSEPLGNGKVIKIINIKNTPKEILTEADEVKAKKLMNKISVDYVFKSIKDDLK